MIGGNRIERRSSRRRAARGGGELPSPSAGLPTNRPSFTETNNGSDGSDIENQMEDNASTTTDNKRKSTSSPPGSAESELGQNLFSVWSSFRQFFSVKQSASEPARELRDLLFNEKLEKKIKEIVKMIFGRIYVV